jgi:hypothetical protein
VSRSGHPRWRVVGGGEKCRPDDECLVAKLVPIASPGMITVIPFGSFVEILADVPYKGLTCLVGEPRLGSGLL